MIDDEQPEEIETPQEKTLRNESIRVLEMLYEQQDIEVIRCPVCQFPYPVGSLIKDIAGMVPCNSCGYSFFLTEDNVLVQLPEILPKKTIKEYTYSWWGRNSERYVGPVQTVSGIFHIGRG